MPDILHISDDYVVGIKPIGVSSESDMPRLLSEAIGGDIFCVHRLDNAVGGVMVFARSKSAAAHLSKQISERRFSKQYLAVIEGTPSEPSGRYTDLLFKDSSKNKSYVVKRMRKGVKEAMLDYNVLNNTNDLSLVCIKLLTGRTHQIRVQFSSRKMPLAGDRRYGSKIALASPALWSHKLEFADTMNGGTVSFTADPPDTYPWNNFKSI